MKVAEHVYHPGKLNSAGEPEVIILAGETIQVWHLDAIRTAGVQRVVMQVEFNVEDLRVGDDFGVFTLTEG